MGLPGGMPAAGFSIITGESLGRVVGSGSGRAVQMEIPKEMGLLEGL